MSVQARLWHARFDPSSSAHGPTAAQQESYRIARKLYDETVAELNATYRLMERLAPLVDGFPTSGILVPYPGTVIYQTWHEVLGCTRWWLDRQRLATLNVPRRREGGRAPASVDEIIALHEAIEKGLLAAKLVPYDANVRQAIERCLVFRRAHNRQALVTPRKCCCRSSSIAFRSDGRRSPTGTTRERAFSVGEVDPSPSGEFEMGYLRQAGAEVRFAGSDGIQLVAAGGGRGASPDARQRVALRPGEGELGRAGHAGRSGPRKPGSPSG